MQQHKRATAQRQGQRIVPSKIVRLLRQTAGLFAIRIRGRTEIVGRTLRPTPTGNRLGQSIVGGQILRTAQLFECGIALLAFDSKGKRQRCQGQPDRLVEILVKALRR